MFDVPFRICYQGLRLTGGASLDVGRDRERRGARFRESDSDERSCAGLDRNRRGVAGIADRRHDDFCRVVDKDESIDDLVAVGLLAVLDPDAVVRIEVQIGEPALYECEKHQSAQQDRRERYPLTATTWSF